jgi:hypothetical protein
MKKQKTKAEKRILKNRRSVIMNVDTNALGKHFCEIVSILWSEIFEVDNDDAQDIELLEMLVGHCRDGWNCAVGCDSPEETMQCIDDSFSDDYEDPTPVLDVMKLAASFKNRLCPNDDIKVKDAEVAIKDGKPAISVSFDVEAAQRRAEAMADSLSLASEIFNDDAIQKALDDVPQDKIEDALLAEIQRQTDDYNNTPQDELGGLTPHEAFHRNRKK